jgi:hypothetical protein
MISGHFLSKKIHNFFFGGSSLNQETPEMISGEFQPKKKWPIKNDGFHIFLLLSLIGSYFGKTWWKSIP